MAARVGFPAEPSGARIYAHIRDGRAVLFDRASVYLKQLIHNPNALPEPFRQPSGKGSRPNHGNYALHRSDGLFVSSVVWGPGDHLGAHDHRTWGLIGVMGNGIRETRYRRVDDRDQEVVAILEEDRSTLVKPGEISLLVPDTDEIHAMANETDRSTVEVHVYGKDLVNLTRYRYDVAANRMIAFASPKFDNC